MGRLTRFIVPAALLIAAYYAIFGGEHTFFDLRRARADREVEAAELVRLKQANDSLKALVDSLQSDPVLLERLARERFGMIRDGEVLYRFAPGDSAAADSTGR